MAKGNARAPKVMLAVEEVPEVGAFLEIDQKIRDLINENPGFYQRLRELVEERNTYLQAAEKIVRANLASCGPFNKISEKLDIDAEKLFDELGDEGFAQVGGYTEQITTYKIDRTRFTSLLHAGHIPEEVKESCTKVTPSYKKPETYVLP